MLSEKGSQKERKVRYSDVQRAAGDQSQVWELPLRWLKPWVWVKLLREGMWVKKTGPCSDGKDDFWGHILSQEEQLRSRGRWHERGTEGLGSWGLRIEMKGSDTTSRNRRECLLWDRTQVDTATLEMLCWRSENWALVGKSEKWEHLKTKTLHSQKNKNFVQVLSVCWIQIICQMCALQMFPPSLWFVYSFSSWWFLMSTSFSIFWNLIYKYF